jgi:hypothetical protein
MGIFFVILAYTLNFIHEVLPHEHFHDMLPDSTTSIFLIMNHEHHSETHSNDEHQDEHQDDHSDQDLPFTHSHSLQSKDYIQFRNNQNQIHIQELSEFVVSIFSYIPPDIILKVGLPKDKSSCYKAVVAQRLPQRAPPAYS